MVPRVASSGLLVRCVGLVWLALACGAFAAPAVHKCRGADGQTSYQEQPCPAGTELPAPVLAPDPPYVPPAPAPALALPEPPGQDRPAGPSHWPQAPLPAMFRCERWDGQESYVTQDPTPRIYQVPLWAVMPEKTSSISGGLSTSRAGQGGGGRSTMGAYTTVQDRCYRMGRGELCGHWSQRADEVHTKLRTAFNDTKPGLEREEDDLREKRALHCGG